MTLGIVPVNEFWSRYRYCRFVSLLIEDGIDPMRLALSQ
jgi:hypothetical protein